MRKPTLLVVAILLALAVWFWPKTATQQVVSPASETMSASRASTPDVSARSSLPATVDAWPEFLPREARETVAAIQRGGPFPHRQDGEVFRNRERLLPRRPHGFYREYTVDTPGVGHRGERRIITGGSPPQVWYYTDDHYDSFRAFEARAARPRR